MNQIMNVGAWLTISIGYIFILYVVWNEAKDRIAEWWNWITKRKNSAEETAE